MLTNGGCFNRSDVIEGRRMAAAALETGTREQLYSVAERLRDGGHDDAFHGFAMVVMRAQIASDRAAGAAGRVAASLL